MRRLVLLFVGVATRAWAQAPGGATDEAAIKRALEADQAAQAAQPAPSPAPQPLEAQRQVQPPGATLLNPATSVILDGAFGYYGVDHEDFLALGLPASGDDPSPDKEGFTVQELEIAFSAAIDPYFEGAVFLTIPNLEGLEVEEGYLLTTSLPGNLQIKGGTFRSQVGRNNTQHLHLQHFTRRPLMTPLLFGADGFRGPGLQVSWLVPDLPWYATLYAEAFSIGAPEEGDGVVTFGGGGRDPSHLTTTAVLEQFWSPTAATSLLLGLNFATGISATCAMALCAPGPRSYLYGGDLFFKWRPEDVVGEQHSFLWSTEYFARSLAGGGPTEGALYTEPVVQVFKRWFLGARLDVTGIPDGPNIPRRYGVAASVTFAPTEFSRLRLYGQELWGGGLHGAFVGFLQAEVSMGAHGAHPF